MAEGTYYIGEDMTETLDALTAGGSYLNAATITYALKDRSGTTITGGTGSYSYTASSDGDYTATIESTVTSLLSEDVLYYLWVTIVSGSYNGSRRLERRAKYRGDS